MKERLQLLYEIYKIDRELSEIESQKGDLPAKIKGNNERKNTLEEDLHQLHEELLQIAESESKLLKENETLAQKIDKNDNLLRAGAMKSNREYNALAKEIDDAYEHVNKNENTLKKEILPKKNQLTENLKNKQTELDEILANLKELEETLEALNKETEEGEKELKNKREEIISKMIPEDLEFYERINQAKFGDAMAVVRKGSCLGCFNSVPPQRAIEIRMTERFFNCESCGRILISSEFINE